MMAGRRPFLSARWLSLAMVNYVVEPELLAPLLPAGVELDTWQGRHYVSLVGFLFADTRVLGLAVPFHRTFEEVNLRFYVRHGGKRGVVFVRELVPRRAIAWTARRFYNEPYVAVPMRHRVWPTIVEYEWLCGGKWQRVYMEREGMPEPILEGSEAEFITEHYWGYCRQRDGSTLEYEVEHPRWGVWATGSERTKVDCDFRAVYGEPWGALSKLKPTSAFIADGSSVQVHHPLTI